MNRDESRSRKVALNLKFKGSFCYPEDADALGTWIGTNNSGLTLCLLNQHSSKPGEPMDLRSDFRTRGEIILGLIELKTLSEIQWALKNLEASSYRPFRLVVVGREGSIFVATWHGKELVFAELTRKPTLFVSSSFGDDSARLAREEKFNSFLRENLGSENFLQSLRKLHRSHAEDFGPRGFCIHHKWGFTVSSTDVAVKRTTIDFCYERAPLCERETQQTKPESRILQQTMECV